MSKVADADRTRRKAVPLTDVGGGVEHVATGALLEPVLQLAGDNLIGIVASPVRQINDEAVAVGDGGALGITAPHSQHHVAAPVGYLGAGGKAGHGMAAGCDPLHVTHGVEQPLPLTVEKACNVVIAICGESRDLDMAGRDGDLFERVIMTVRMLKIALPAQSSPAT